MNIVIFFLMNILVGVSAYLLAFKIFKFRSFLETCLGSFLFYISQVVITQLVLGIIGLLYLPDLLFINILILVVICLVAKSKKTSLNLEHRIIYPTELFKGRLNIFLLSVILGFAAVKIAINLVNPPSGWDSLNYHFTFPVEWLKHGNLDIPITINDDPSPSYYPINGSLFFLWFMLPFKSVFIADISPLLFFIMGFLAIFSLARRLNISREYSLLAAIVFSLIPNYFKQLEIAYVDIMVSTLFFICLNFLFLLSREFSLQNVLLSAVSLGLLIGTKTVALPYSVLLLMPFLYYCFKNTKKGYYILLFLIPVLALGGFSYIRNFIDTGNPMYPLDFSLFGKTIFKGVMNLATYAAHFKSADYRLSKILFHEGLGIQTFLLVLPAMFLALPLALWKNRKKLNFICAYFFILPILLYLIYRYVIPLANTRYLYAALGLGVVSGFYLLEILKVPRLAVNIFVAVCTLSSAAELASNGELIAAIVLTLILGIVFYFVLRTSGRRRLSLKPALIPILFLIILGSFSLKRYYTTNEYPRYITMRAYSGFWPDAVQAWDWLNNNTKGDNIAYTGRPVPFPLYGTSFKNNVYYASVNETEPAKLHYFPNSRYVWDGDFISLHKNLGEPNNYRGYAQYLIWLQNLLKRNSDYLFVYSLHQINGIIFPIEDVWALAHPKTFSLVFNNESIHIYRLIK
jgi:hypothetical protein